MPDMHITVGHIVDNPTFPFDGDVEITETDDDGTVHTMFDSRHNSWSDMTTYILLHRITYMVVNKSTGVLRLEVG